MPNRYAGSPEDRAALDAYVKLWRSAHAVEVATNRHLADHHLTVSQFAVIEALYHVGPLSQRGLADKILRSSGNLTMVIDNLERDGLVIRERATDDRRVMIVSLTPHGRQVIERVLPEHVRGIREVFELLEPHELQQLCDLTRKLGMGLNARTGGGNRTGRRERAAVMAGTRQD